jgi:hypothetical protein
MRPILIALAAGVLLAACGDDNNNNTTTQPVADCATYCSQMATTCTTTDLQYTGLTGDCNAYCNNNAWPAGTAGDASGNTRACRVTHVGLAAAATTPAEKTLHCGHAGPTGTGVTGGNLNAACGSLCENYCFLALKNCTGANGAGLGFTDQTTCLAACALFPTNGIIGGATAPSGNNVQCRLYHAGAAGALALPSPHCGHAQVISRPAPGATTGAGPCT